MVLKPCRDPRHWKVLLANRIKCVKLFNCTVHGTITWSVFNWDTRSLIVCYANGVVEKQCYNCNLPISFKSIIMELWNHVLHVFLLITFRFVCCSIKKNVNTNMVWISDAVYRLLAHLNDMLTFDLHQQMSRKVAFVFQSIMKAKSELQMECARQYFLIDSMCFQLKYWSFIYEI